jgi:hypothetical protein
VVVGAEKVKCKKDGFGGAMTRIYLTIFVALK